MTRVNLDLWDGAVTRVFVVNNDYEWGYRGYDTELDPPFYVVHATYETGDTFGNSFDAVIVGVCADPKDAHALLQEAANFEGSGSLSNGFYVPWNGYFDRLLSLHIRKIDEHETDVFFNR